MPAIKRMANRRNPFFPMRVGSLTFTVGAEASNAIAVTGQLYDAGGKAVSGVAVLDVYLSDAATATDIAASAPSGGIAVGSYGKILATLVSGKMVRLASDASGRISLTLTESTAKTFYMAAVMPDGSLAIATVAFA